MLNPILMNDWPIKKFLAAVGAVLLAIWALVGLQAAGVGIPVLRPVVALVFLAYLPGVAILRVLKIHNLGSVQVLLYSVGLSLAFVMFTGALINATYPFFGVSKPITLMPLMISFTALLLTFCAIAYFRNSNFSSPAYVNARGLFSPPVLFLLLLPLWSILGTQLVNFYSSNILLMTLIVMIVITVLLIGFNKFIPESLYPWAVLTIVLSLLLYRSLISPYISGYDIHEEYASAALVQSAGRWEPSYPTIINGLLVINVLPALVSDVSGLDLTLIFKTMYPLLFSVACVGLYHVFRGQTNAKVAFFALLFIVSVGRVYYDIALIPRQLAANLFLVALMIIITEKDDREGMRAPLLAIMGFSMVVSHYGFSYIYLAILACYFAAERLTRSVRLQRLLDGVRTRLGVPMENGISAPARITPGIPTIFPLLFAAFTFVWYIYTASGIPVRGYSRIAVDFIQNIATVLFKSGSTPPVVVESIGNSAVVVLSKLSEMSGYLKESLIMIGGLAIFWGISPIKLSRSYLYLSAFAIILFIATMSPLAELVLFFFAVYLVFALFLPVVRRHAFVWLSLISAAGIALGIFFPKAAAIIVPPSTNRLVAELITDVGRLQHIALLFLAPFLVIGAIAAVRAFSRPRQQHARNWWPLAVSIFLGLVILLDSGFAWFATGNYTGSPSLNQAWVRKHGNILQKASLYLAVTPEHDVLSATWLDVYRTPNSKIFATFDDVHVHPLTSYGMITVDNTERISTSQKVLPDGSYIYLQYLNVVEGIGTAYRGRLPGSVGRHDRFDIAEIAYLWSGENRIYSNGGSEIYQ